MAAYRQMIMFVLVCGPLALSGCTRGDVGEFFFKRSLVQRLVELCGSDDPDCIAAVHEQTDGCMVESNFPRLLLSDYRDDELQRFTEAFYACLVDPLGNPYFVVAPG